MIFVSYSHDDQVFCDAFVKHTSTLKRFVKVQTWSDAKIGTGRDWKREIKQAMDTSSVAVLLVTSSFFHSDFIQDGELPYFLKARQARGLELLWVLVSDCYWKKTPLANIQAAINTSKPLDSLSTPQQNTAWRILIEQIDEAWRRYERPKMNLALRGRPVKRREVNFPVLARPARRKTEIFVRAEWARQLLVAPGFDPEGEGDSHLHIRKRKDEVGASF
jgi:hypothetical protein